MVVFLFPTCQNFRCDKKIFKKKKKCSHQAGWKEVGLPLNSSREVHGRRSTSTEPPTVTSKDPSRTCRCQWAAVRSLVSQLNSANDSGSEVTSRFPRRKAGCVFGCWLRQNRNEKLCLYESFFCRKWKFDQIKVWFAGLSTERCEVRNLVKILAFKIDNNCVYFCLFAVKNGRFALSLLVKNILPLLPNITQHFHLKWTCHVTFDITYTVTWQVNAKKVFQWHFGPPHNSTKPPSQIWEVPEVWKLLWMLQN